MMKINQKCHICSKQNIARFCDQWKKVNKENNKVNTSNLSIS